MPGSMPVPTVTHMMDFDPTRPKWQQIADEVRRRIANGTLQPRALVSEVQLEAEFGVARSTIRKATAALRDEGLIVTTPGMGSFVAGPTGED